ncbi:alpha/beta hydrolase [Sphingobacterium gobiense]|uniref:Alpha/beta hydrolase n=1 Tax=Sphingobacterium gobiense TaxID=1382456 RepID=A0A2S9JGF7_9SPHI|nr:alpha/beta fold hydrolase [Sphingobacterium gobiense]PRD52030.1 alpha/beta hydrolase [Sphingobacterium gobiense]
MNGIKWAITIGLVIVTSLGYTQQFTSEDVRFNAQRDTITFGATITSPEQAGKFPALVLVTGTGAQNRDCEMAGNPLFRPIAEYLSARGYVVLRMDDRGVGQTTGDYSMATTSDFAQDALEAVTYLKKHPKVDNRRIGLLGHSEGGAAIAIAASQSADVAFLVSLAGLATDGLESLFVQNENLVANSPMSAVDKKRSNEINRLMFAVAYQYADSDSLENRLEETYAYWKEKDSIYAASLGMEHDRFRFPIWYYVQQATGPWYRYFVRYNAAKVLSQVDVPVLAINGDKDPFVDPVNLTYWEKYTRSANKGLVTTKLLPNVNHLMQACETCDTKEYADLSTIPDSTLQLILDWLNRL